jgi:diguanylate cyclase (GGDEF)-like protein/PAS domain S-box-containing protein
MMDRRLKPQKNPDKERFLDVTVQHIHQFLNLGEILHTSVAEARHLLAAERVLVYQFEPDLSGKIIAESVINEQFSIQGKIIKDFCFEDNWLSFYRQGISKAIEDIYTADLNQCYVEFLALHQVRASLIVPILLPEQKTIKPEEDTKVIDFPSQNHLWGFLIAHQCSVPRQWQQSEIDSLKKLAILIAIAIQQSTLNEQVHKAQEELEIQVQKRTLQLQQANEQLQGEIEKRDRAEKALKESQILIERIAHSTPVSIYIYDLIEKINIYANREIATILGYQPEEIQKIGSNLLERLMHPEDFHKYTQHQQKYYSAKEGETIEFEYRMKHADGEWRWLVSRDTIFSRTPEGKPKQILGTAEDITERKQAETRLQQVNHQLNTKVKELEQRQREMNLLSEAINFLQACLTVEEAYSALSTLIPPMFPHSSGGVFTINPSNNLVEAAATWGTALGSETMFAPHECWGLRRGRSHWIEQTKVGLSCQHNHRDSRAFESLCVPTIAHGETLGMLYLSFSESGQLTEGKQQLASAVAEQTALALANLKLRETLQHQSVRDPLTSLFNRRYMEEFLNRELSRAQRQEQPIGIIVLDVDHFKHFNDTFGHEAGDTVLRELGILLRNNIRNSDIACRYGGEEMVLILPEASLEDTKDRAEELRLAIKHLNLSYRRNSLGPITVSLGVACFPQHGLTGDALLRTADRALYRAKAEGRDRTIAA